MKEMSRVEGILSILFVVALVCLWMLLFEPIRQAWTHRAPPPPVERPARIDALVTSLKTTRVLRELDPDPTSCGRVPKGNRGDRCFYRAGDMKVVLAWPRRTVNQISLWISKTEPRGAAPFAWADLSDMIRLLCDADDANTIAQESLAQLARAPWYREYERVTAEVDGATRSAPPVPDATCRLNLRETVRGTKVDAALWIKRVSPD